MKRPLGATDEPTGPDLYEVIAQQARESMIRSAQPLIREANHAGYEDGMQTGACFGFAAGVILTLVVLVVSRVI